MNYKRSVLTFEKIGLILLCVYIFFSYTAHDIVIPTKIVSFALYLFLAWGLFDVFMRRNVKLSIHTLWYFVFLCWSLVTMTYSPEIQLLGGEMRLMIVAFVVSFVFQLYVNNERDFEVVAWIFSLSSLAFVGILYFTDSLVVDANNRLGEDVLGNANAFSGMIMYAVIFELWLIVYKKCKLITKVMLLLMILANYYALTLSAGRLSFVVPIVFLYVILLCKQDRVGHRHIIKYTLFVAIIIAIIFFLMMNVEEFYETLGYRMESLINGAMGVEEHGASAKIREKMRNLAIERWIENPLIGHGFDSFKYLAQSEFRHFFYSHCNFTELLYNGGVISFVLYYWIYYKLIKTIIKTKKASTKYKAFAIGMTVSILVYDYGIISYSTAYVQILLALSFKGLALEGNDLKGDSYYE